MPCCGRKWIGKQRCGIIWQALALGGWLLSSSGSTALPAWGDDYRDRVAPLLGKNCVACHNAKTAEGGLNLESYDRLMVGGDSGVAVAAGDADSSELIARMVATDDSVMPPEGNSVGAQRLTAEEVTVIAQWINSGAEPPSGNTLPTIQWRTISQAVSPIYALNLSADGHYLSFAKGNVAYLVPQPMAAGPWDPLPLLDQELHLSDGTALAATDLDLVHSLVFSHDSQRLAVGGFRTVKLWERQTQAQRIDLPLPAQLTMLPTTGSGLGPVASDDHHVLTVWDLERGQEPITLGPSPTRPMAAAWATDSSQLYVLDETQRLWRWQPRAAEPAAPWEVSELILGEPRDELLAIAAAAENQVWVVSRSGRGLRIRPDGEQWRTELAFDIGRPLSLARFSDDGHWLVAIDQEATATLWRVADGVLTQTLGEDYQRGQRRQQTQRQIARQEGWVKRLTDMLPGLEEEIKKEEEARAKVAENHQKTVEAQQAKEQEIAAAQQTVNDTEQMIATLEQQLADRRQQLAEQQKAVSDLQSQLTPLEQNVAKAVQALNSADAGLQLAREKVPTHQARIESQQGELLTTQERWTNFLANPIPDVVAATFDTAGKQVLLIDTHGQGRLYGVDSGQSLAVLPPPAELPAGETIQTWVTGPSLTSVRTQSFAWQWDLRLPWQLVKTWGSENDDLFSFRVTALAFSPDDQYLAVGSGPPSRYGDLKVLSLATGEVERDYGQVHSDTILALEYSPDGRWLASAGADKLCRLHDPQTGGLVKILEGHTHFVQSVSWHEQAQALATASADKTVKTWDVETGERRQSISGFAKEISAMAYVGDTDQILTVALDGHTRLHRGDNAQLVRSFPHHPQPLYALTRSVDGRYVVVGDHAGQLRIYQVDDGQQLRQWPE